MDWFRWYAGTVTDPKWRVISRRAGQPLHVVLAVWAAVLENANAAESRGRLESFDAEDVAAALDLEADQVRAVIGAMQGKVLEGDNLSGWERRQPKREREDRTASERKRRQRDKDRDTEESRQVTPSHALEESRGEESTTKETVAKATGDESPNDDTTEPARPDDPTPPETPDPESVWAASRGLIAGAVREHAWLHRGAPQFGAARGRKWDMQNELSIARELLKQYSPEELMGGIEHWRRVNRVADGAQWSLAACYAEGKRHLIELAVEGWRSAQIDAIDLTEFLEVRRAS